MCDGGVCVWGGGGGGWEVRTYYKSPLQDFITSNCLPLQ